jgi:hypothetical protein
VSMRRRPAVPEAARPSWRPARKAVVATDDQLQILGSARERQSFASRLTKGLIRDARGVELDVRVRRLKCSECSAAS